MPISSVLSLGETIRPNTKKRKPSTR